MSQLWNAIPASFQPWVIAVAVAFVLVAVLALARYVLTSRFRDAFARAMMPHYLAPSAQEGFRMSDDDRYKQVWGLVRVWWLPGRYWTHIPHRLARGVSDDDIKTAAGKATAVKGGDWQTFVYHIGWGVWVLSDGRSQ